MAIIPLISGKAIFINYCTEAKLDDSEILATITWSRRKLL